MIRGMMLRPTTPPLVPLSAADHHGSHPGRSLHSSHKGALDSWVRRAASDPFGPPLRVPHELPISSIYRGLESSDSEDEEPNVFMSTQSSFAPAAGGIRSIIESLERKIFQRLDRLEDAFGRVAGDVAAELASQAFGSRPPVEPLVEPGSPRAASSSGLRVNTPHSAPTPGGLAVVDEVEPEEGGKDGLQEVEPEEGGNDGLQEFSVVQQRSVRFQPPPSTAIAIKEAKVEDANEFAAEGGSMTSSVAEPVGFELRREWRVGMRSFGERMGIPEEQFKTLEDLVEQRSQCARDRFWWVSTPSGRFRMAWDILTMLLVGFDMAVIPVNLAFLSGDESSVSAVAFWPTLLFWTVDIPLTFCTGYYRKGRVELAPYMIAKQYLSTWFILDACIVGSSWSEVIIDTQTRGLALGRVGKTLRILRIIRSMRLLRLVKLRRIMEDIQDRVTSEYLQILMSVFKIILVIVWTNHFIACLWWAIGMSGPTQGGPDAEWSWTSHFAFQDDGIGYQYFTALHWSLTQFTPASMEVSPRNLPERIFAVVVLLFAMIVFSSFVSSITAAMTQLRSLSSSVEKNFVMLRRYLRARSAPQDLTVRIMRCVEHRLGVRKGEVPESDVSLLQHLSTPLQMELLSHVYAPFMMRHPFFRKLSEADPCVMQRICLVAVQRVSLSTGDALFTEACGSEQMFFVRSGRLRYYPSCCSITPQNTNTCLDEPPATMMKGSSTNSFKNRSLTRKPINESLVEEGEWFCESSLWCPWAHLGTMVATQMSEVLALDAATFASVTRVHRLVASGAQRYGTAFVDRLNAVCGNPDYNLRDICQFFPEDLEEMVQKSFNRRTSTDLDRPGSFRRSSDARMQEPVGRDLQATPEQLRQGHEQDDWNALSAHEHEVEAESQAEGESRVTLTASSSRVEL